jgi:DNA (cytosine-5)-methyltransferase 1
MRNGIVFPLAPWAPLTGGIGSGLWRTPDASIASGGAANAEDRKRQGHAIGLHDQVNTPSMWPTPQARDHKDTGPNVNWGKVKAKCKLAGAAGGSLNPTWVEWLMGYPQNWTSLED